MTHGPGWRGWKARAVVVLAALILPASAAGAPVTFNTALPVARGQVLWREKAVVAHSGDDPSGRQREVSRETLVSALGYGFTARLAGFVVLPASRKRLRSPGAETRTSRGLGDVLLFARLTVFQDDARGRTFRIAPLAGVEAPTGRDDVRDAQGRLPPGLQPGSGTWDPLIGVVASWQELDFQVDLQVSHLAHGKRGGFSFGDQNRLDASLQVRIWPGSLDARSGVPDFLYGVLELNGVDRDPDSLAGRTDPDTGGTQVFLTPGLQWVTRRWIWEAVVQLPVVQNLNGNALETGWIFHGGFRIHF